MFNLVRTVCCVQGVTLLYTDLLFTGKPLTKYIKASSRRAAAEHCHLTSNTLLNYTIHTFFFHILLQSYLF